jgi:predicted dehydrogenase
MAGSHHRDFKQHCRLKVQGWPQVHCGSMLAAEPTTMTSYLRSSQPAVIRASRRLGVLAAHASATTEAAPSPVAAASATVLRLAIVGVGSGVGGSGIGRRHLANALAIPTCEVVAIADPSLLSIDIAAQHGVRHFIDTAEMLRETHPDAVVVSVPTALHVAVSVLCLEHGAHVLVEKPLAPTVEEGRKLVSAAQASSRLLVVGHHRRLDPDAIAARALLRGGSMGPVIGGSMLWSTRKPDAYFSVAHRRQKGAGPLVTNFSHDVDMLRYLCGELESVFAMSSSKQRQGSEHGQESEDTAALVMRFVSGALFSATISDAAPSPWGWEMATGENDVVPCSSQSCYWFLCQRGALSFPSNRVWSHAAAAAAASSGSVKLDAGIGDWSVPLAAAPPPEAEQKQRQPLGAWRDELLSFLDAVRAAALSVEAHSELDLAGMGLTSGADGLASVAAVEAALESVELGVAVKPSFTLSL